MKKITKRALSLLLASLMVLGVSTATGAAAPGKPPRQFQSAAAAVPQDMWLDCTLEITTPPTKTSFVMYEEWPDLSGLVFKASGGNLDGTVTVDYDIVKDDWAQAQDKLLWDIWWSYDNLVEGENEIYLYAYAYKCTEFTPVKTVDGVEYGYFDTEYVFGVNTTFTVTVEANPGYPGPYRVLALDAAETVALERYYEYDDYSEWSGSAYFKFTAPSDGFYAFRSDGGEIGGTLYSKDGDVLYARTVDPWAYLYDENDNWLGSDHDSGGDYNFLLYRQMKRGEVIYLYTNCWASEESAYTVKVTRVGEVQPVLRLRSNDIRVNFHDFINIDALLEGTEYYRWDVQIDFDRNYISWWDWDGLLCAVENGETYITITAPGGAAATVKVTIGYSTAQWLCYVLLGGWAWLDYTNAGPFNLVNEIGKLLQYGVTNSLRDLLADWAYSLYSWLRYY